MCSLVETNIALGFGEKEELLIIDSLGFPNSPNTCLNDAWLSYSGFTLSLFLVT